MESGNSLGALLTIVRSARDGSGLVEDKASPTGRRGVTNPDSASSDEKALRDLARQIDREGFDSHVFGEGGEDDEDEDEVAGRSPTHEEDDAVAKLRAYMRRNRMRPLEVFRTVDKDRNGTVEPVELARWVATAGVSDDAATVAEIVRRFDRDADGRIAYDEFNRALSVVGRARREIEDSDHGPVVSPGGFGRGGAAPRRPASAAMEQIHAYLLRRRSTADDLFRQLDRDNSGAVDVHELGQFLSMLGVRGTDAAGVLASFDARADGKISLSEWRGVLA